MTSPKEAPGLRTVLTSEIVEAWMANSIKK